MTWTAIVIAVVVATMIVALMTDTPAPLEEDERTWPAEQRNFVCIG
jgi:hypothetical protein